MRLLRYWYEIRANFWFIPSLMVLGAIGLSLLTLWADRTLETGESIRLRFLWGGGPQAARGMMEVIAGSMMTVASLTFSLTIMTISQASSQFGPRLLRNFLRDRGNQVVLGTFVATFVYCLLVLRAIRSGVEEGEGVVAVPEFVPYFSVSMGILLALASLGVLIYFIHHVAQSIYTPNVVSAVAADLMAAIERLFPGEDDPLRMPDVPASEIHFPDEFNEKAVRVNSTSSGYLAAVDYTRLLEIAVRDELHLAISHRPGDFIIQGDDLARIWPPERATEELQREMRGDFDLSRQRLGFQDVFVAIDQLVEIAVRALSTGINDPFTAMNCIDWLGVALSRLAEKRIPPPYFCDEKGQARILLLHPVTFQSVTDAAFNQIRQQSAGQVAVQIRLLDVIAAVTEQTQDEEERAALDRQARMIRRSSRRLQMEFDDVQDIDERYLKIEEAEEDGGEV